MAFGSTHRTLFGRAEPVSPASLERARQFVRALDADLGGTEIGSALRAAYAVKAEPGLSRDLLLITDGQVHDVEPVIAAARRSGHRLFTVGVGSAPAEGIVRGLAAATGGASEFVVPREDMAARILRHFQRMYAPAARRAAVRWPARPLGTLPDRIRTVHGGDTLNVFAWFAHEPSAGEPVVLEVSLADGTRLRQEATLQPFDHHAAGSGASGQAEFGTLARMAAAARLSMIDDDEDEAAAAIAVQYQLVSRWTSCLVVHARAEGEKPAGLPDLIKVRQTVAAGWHGMGTVHDRMADMLARRDVNHESMANSRLYSRSSVESDWVDDFSEVFFEQSFASRMALPAGPTIPADLVAWLNGRGIDPLPSLEELADAGFTDIAARVRRLVDAGEDEVQVVLAFLQVVAGADAAGLGRWIRRGIRHGCKAHAVPEALIDCVRAMLA